MYTYIGRSVASLFAMAPSLISINGRMHNLIMVKAHNGILHRNEHERTTITGTHMNDLTNLTASCAGLGAGSGTTWRAMHLGEVADRAVHRAGSVGWAYRQSPEEGLLQSSREKCQWVALVWWPWGCREEGTGTFSRIRTGRTGVWTGCEW